jgi:hypothetical protein
VSKYRKKPVVVEAMQYTGKRGNAAAIMAWAGVDSISEDLTGGLEIDTLEGTMRANVNDWVIRGVKGEFYPCKPDVFAATYEPAHEDDPQSEALRRRPDQEPR